MSTPHRIVTTGLVTAALIACTGISPGWAQTDEDSVAERTPASSSPPLSSMPWPNRFPVGSDNFTVYPPQLERWEGDRLDARAAVAVQPTDADKPIFGVVVLSARTDLDRTSDTVTVHDIDVRSGSFPTAEDRAAEYTDAVRRHLAAVTWRVARERLRGDFAIDQASERSRAQPLRNEPPRIVYVQSPTVLVPIDGAPVLREMDGLGLRRVINTRALILQDQTSGRYFLSVAGWWLEASSLDGPWMQAQAWPSALDDAKRQASEQGQVDLLEDEQNVSERAPKVVVSTGPTELVQTDGPPQYAPIAHTDLLFVTNSPNRLFFDLRTQTHYVLLAGRWYRTRVLAQGGWEYVPGSALPADFAQIPDDHPTATVRAAVAGTPQAQEAVIANSVPEVATVKRTAARLEITYDGAPQFRPIEGTTLEWAVNAPVPVIRVDWRSYYALDNGVWFFADSPDGPWTAATSVPTAVYTIPRNHPLHYVTYVRIYDATPDEVIVGYTPGYVGSYVSVDSTVVYGSGWTYHPWIGSVWYAPPATWGFGFSFWYSWWNPWPWYPYGWWAGWGPVPCYYPAWGPWYPYHHHVFVAGVHTSTFHGGDYGHGFHHGPHGVTNVYGRWGRQAAAPQHVFPQRRTGSRWAAADPGRFGMDRNTVLPSHGVQPRYDRNQLLNRSEIAAPSGPRWVRPQQRTFAPNNTGPGSRTRMRSQPSASAPGSGGQAFNAPRSPGLRADQRPGKGGGPQPRYDRNQQLNRAERAPQGPRWVRPQPQQRAPVRDSTPEPRSRPGAQAFAPGAAAPGFRPSPAPRTFSAAPPAPRVAPQPRYDRNQMLNRAPHAPPTTGIVASPPAARWHPQAPSGGGAPSASRHWAPKGQWEMRQGGSGRQQRN